MENRKFVFVYFDDKCLCSHPEEAIRFINELQYRGVNLICNNNCSVRIKALFEGDIVYYPSGYINYIKYNKETIPGFSELATTGCSTTRIKFYPALADTLEEHEMLYRNKLEEEKQKRLKDNEQRINKRIIELNEQRKGWYAVSLTFDRSIYSHGDFKYVDSDFSGKIIAESGMDAYIKTVDHLKKSIDILPGSQYPVAHSSRFWFEFLGVKTDDGYSVDVWNEWKSKGQI